MSQDPWLILASAPGLNGTLLFRAMEVLGNADALVSASPDALRSAGLPDVAAQAIAKPDQNILRQASQWLTVPDRHLVRISDESYPALLAEIPDPPVALFAAGDPMKLSLPQVAIVGSRNGTPGGLENARQFARYLASNGFSVASGLALGVDTAAHEGALEAGGNTVAVLGGGPDHIYPRQNSDLAARLTRQGTLISEFPPGRPPRPENFPRRNRIISGISAGTLVIEAGVRSGALVTARCAAEQGREVFAVPGSIHNPLARGCHKLIRDGARLTETAAELVAELGGLLSESVYGAASETDPRRSMAELDPDYDRLLGAMGYDPVGVDALVVRTGLTTEQVSSMLLKLELQGCVASASGGRYQQVHSTGLSR